MKGFLDYLGLWTAINMIAWFTLWWTYDKNVTVEQELHLLLQTSLSATALTLAVWGVTRVSRAGSAVPKKYAERVDQALDAAMQVNTDKKEGPDGTGR